MNSRISCALIFLCLPFTLLAQQKRVALVIGAQNYTSLPPLRNSLADALDLSASLKSKGFVVETLLDPKSKNEIKEAIIRYSNAMQDVVGGVGVIFYAGHGMQFEGNNYIIPTSAKLEMSSDLDDQCLKMNAVMSVLNASKKSLNILLLDACRSMPSFTRAAEQGWAKENAPRGSIIVFATEAGKVASDGHAKNGLFTSKLLKEINEPGLNITDVLKRVKQGVFTESGEKQLPTVEDNTVGGDFYFTESTSGHVNADEKKDTLKGSLIRGGLDLPKGTSNLIEENKDSVNPSLFPVYIRGKYGYVDSAFNEVIKPIYEFALEFKEGRARVIKNGRWLIIDELGKQISGLFDVIGPLSSGLSYVSNSKRFGFIDKEGTTIIPLIYEEVLSFGTEGLAPAKINGAWGFINKKNEPIIKFEYDAVRPFHEGYAAVSKNGKWNYVNTEGKLLLENYVSNASDFHLGMASIKQENWGFINTTGKVVIPSIFEVVKNFSGEIAAVKDRKGWGFVNKSGNPVEPTTFELVLDFSEGFAAVQEENKWGFINTQGDVVFPDGYHLDKSLGFDHVNSFKNGFAAVKVKNGWGFINTKGNAITSFTYDQVNDFSQGLAAVKENGRWGFINQSGKIVVPIEYASVNDFQNGYAKVVLANKTFYVNKKGIRFGGDVFFHRPE
ncbi:MAG TPA: hypothetical protein DGG95_01600 [Cytophagales bacterium]|jgi:hypothetical protein|nr:hypothetical protein [Cytophagales bacterium]